MHGNTATIVLDSDFTHSGIKGIVNAINNQIANNTVDSSGNPSNMSVKVSSTVRGSLRFLSDETGNYSGFEIIDNGNINKLQMSAGQYFSNSLGTPANPSFEYNLTASNYGFNVAGESPTDDLVFTIHGITSYFL